MLNESNAIHIYKMLTSNAHTDESFITLRQIAYEERGIEGTGTEVVSFKGEGGRTKFMATLEAWKERVGVTIETSIEEAHRLMNNVTWNQ